MDASSSDTKIPETADSEKETQEKSDKFDEFYVEVYVVPCHV